MSDVAVGVDVGGTKVLAVLVDQGGRVVDSERRDTPHTSDLPAGEPTARVVHDALRTLATRSGHRLSDVPIGIGLPGMMSRDGVLAFAPNLPSASGADLAARMRELDPSLRVICENDADCAVVAEHAYGAARGRSDVVMVTLGTGIGGGIMSEGRLLRGRNGFAGEIGHMVVDARGPRCPCGNRGCWERYASGAGVARLAREAASAGRLAAIVEGRGGDPEAVTGEDVTSAAARGDLAALEVIDEVGWWLALGIANLAAILDATCFVIGGGLSVASELLLPAASRHLNSLVEGASARGQLELLAAELGPEAGAIGAALVAKERLA